jgi:homoserine kinase type II
MLGPTLYDVASAAMYAGDHVHLLRTYPQPTDGVKTFLQFRYAVQAAYFAYRIESDIQTGVVPGNENPKGLNDARRGLLGH